MQLQALFLLAICLLAIAPAVAQGAELDALQGKWETRFEDQGKSLRMLKIVEKNRETVETYDGDTLLHRHIVTLEERDANGITVMHYTESEVTYGPRKGLRGKPGCFISKRHGDTWYNVQGLETNSTVPLTVMLFKRVNGAVRESKEGGDKSSEP